MIFVFLGFVFEFRDSKVVYFFIGIYQFFDHDGKKCMKIHWYVQKVYENFDFVF